MKNWLAEPAVAGVAKKIYGGLREQGTLLGLCKEEAPGQVRGPETSRVSPKSQGEHQPRRGVLVSDLNLNV